MKKLLTTTIAAILATSAMTAQADQNDKKEFNHKNKVENFEMRWEQASEEEKRAIAQKMFEKNQEKYKARMEKIKNNQEKRNSFKEEKREKMKELKGSLKDMSPSERQEKMREIKNNKLKDRKSYHKNKEMIHKRRETQKEKYESIKKYLTPEQVKTLEAQKSEFKEIIEARKNFNKE